MATNLTGQTIRAIKKAILGSGAGKELLNLLNLKVAFTIGAEATNVINVAVQVNDSEGNPVTEAIALPFYLSSDTAGQVPATVAHSVGISIGTDGALLESIANLSGVMISEADGDIDIDMEEAGALTRYLCVIMPNGRLAISGAITHAA